MTQMILTFQTWEKHQVAIENLSDVKGYATADLWVPHPTKSYLWKMYTLFLISRFILF